MRYLQYSYEQLVFISSHLILNNRGPQIAFYRSLPRNTSASRTSILRLLTSRQTDRHPSPTQYIANQKLYSG